MIDIGLDGHPVEIKTVRVITKNEIDASDMVVFDRLPKAVKDALNSTVFKWTAKPARDALNAGVFPYDLVKIIMTMDADKVKKESDVYGRA